MHWQHVTVTWTTTIMYETETQAGIFTSGWSSIWSSRTLRPPCCLTNSRIIQIQIGHDWSYELITPCMATQNLNQWWQDTRKIVATEYTLSWGPCLDHESYVTTTNSRVYQLHWLDLKFSASSATQFQVLIWNLRVNASHRDRDSQMKANTGSLNPSNLWANNNK